MALACKKAKAHYVSLSGYPSNVWENEMEKKFTDGDFVVKYCRDDGFYMYDDKKIPIINKEQHDKILEFAKKKNLKAVQTDYGVHTDLIEEEHLKDKIIAFLKDFRYGKRTATARKAIIRVRDNFFASKDSQLFEEFGREVIGLKTESEKAKVE